MKKTSDKRTRGARRWAAVCGICALCLSLLSGCTTWIMQELLESGAESSRQAAIEQVDLQSYYRPRAPVPFSELTYVRPDLEALERQMLEQISGIRQGDSLAAIFEHLKSARDLLSDYDTMYVLSAIYSDMDLSDTYWYGEWQFCSDGYEVYNSLWSDVYAAVSDGDYYTQLLPLWDTEYDVQYRSTSNSYQSDLLVGETVEIIDQAIAIIDEATVSYEGEDITLDAAYDSEEYAEACAAWYEAYGEQLLALYTRMVAVCNEKARDYYGYTDYSEFMFDSYQRDYTPRMARAFCENIVEHFLPLDDAIVEYGYWDDIYKYYGDFDEHLATSRTVLSAMDPRMVEALDCMQTYSLYYNEWGENTRNRPYVNFLHTPNVPFLFCPYTDDLYSVSDFNHEFGHFYEMFTVGEKYCIPDDLAEVHSQAMSLLYAETYQTLEGDSDLLQYVLADIVDTLISQSFNANVELQAYALDKEEITVDNLRKIGEDTSILYGYGQKHELIARYQWLSDTELFTDPFQPFCYAASAGVSLDLWRLSQTDMPSALEKYDKLVNHEKNHRLMSNVAAAGMNSPFQDGWVEETAAFLRAYLIEMEDAEAV